MKLILATNQTEKFRAYYAGLKAETNNAFDYSSYRGLLFVFDPKASLAVNVYDTTSGRQLSNYDGVYINGYLHDYELAIAVGVCAGYLHIPYYNSEISSAPSLSKLSEYARLAAAGIPIPRTIAGTKSALLEGQTKLTDISFPAVLKRADADRGIDNFKIISTVQAAEMLAGYDDTSIWILQEYVPNDGFYRLNYFGGDLAFCIFRSLEQRPDGNELKAHMYKPRGASNASLIPVADIPAVIREISIQALRTMRREIGGVDCLYNAATGEVCILEVNYNPQIVTSSSFDSIRRQAYIDTLLSKW